MQDQSISRLNNFCSLKSTICLFLYEKEPTMKLAKWDANSLKEKRVGLDGYTIYKIYIQEQIKVLKVKDLGHYWYFWKVIR